MRVKLLNCLAVFVLVLSPYAAFAETGHTHDHGAHKVDTAHEKNIQELFVDLEAVVGKVSEAVKAKELSKLHELTEELSHLSAHISEKASVEKKERIAGSTKNISSLANSLHVDGDKGNQAGVENHLKKLQGMMIVLKGQLN